MNKVMCSDPECTEDNRFCELITGEYCNCGYGYLKPYDYVVRRARPDIYGEPTSTRKHLPKVASSPPVKYDISIIKGQKAYADISRLTNSLCDINDERLTDKLYHDLSSNKDVYISYIQAPSKDDAFSRDIIKGVVGQGEWFMILINSAHIHYALYDRATNCFIFWASTHKQLIKAMNATYWRIKAVFNDIRAMNTPCVYGYDDEESCDSYEEEERYAQEEERRCALEEEERRCLEERRYQAVLKQFGSLDIDSMTSLFTGVNNMRM
jgi:hypothetical protein